MIKLFSLQKNTNKKTDAQPDYRISLKVGEGFAEGGACWLKKDKNGNNYLSCKLADEFLDHTNPAKSKKGWHMEADSAVGGSKTPEIDL